MIPRKQSKYEGSKPLKPRPVCLFHGHLMPYVACMQAVCQQSQSPVPKPYKLLQQEIHLGMHHPVAELSTYQ